jgi:ORF13 protein
MAIVLRDIYDRKNNYFDDLRFILATLVVFYHSYELIKEPTHDFITMMVLGQSSLGEMAVYAFYTQSG